jgi:hypothetical protein
MRCTFAFWRRSSKLLSIERAANGSFALIAMPVFANIDWTRTGMLAAAIALFAIVVALSLAGRRMGPQDDGYLRRVGNMPAEPQETAPRRLEE